jgi:hypothetical protein
MTVRAAHPAHRWNQHDGTCRQCGCSSARRAAVLPCAKAVPRAARAAPSTKTPDIQAASLVGARDLFPHEGD